MEFMRQHNYENEFQYMQNIHIKQKLYKQTKSGNPYNTTIIVTLSKLFTYS